MKEGGKSREEFILGEVVGKGPMHYIVSYGVSTIPRNKIKSIMGYTFWTVISYTSKQVTEEGFIYLSGSFFPEKYKISGLTS